MKSNRDVEHPRPSALASKWVMQNRKWLEQTYPGKWIAVGPEGLLAVGDSLQEVAEQAEAKGESDPLFTGVRRKEFQNIDLIRPR